MRNISTTYLKGRGVYFKEGEKEINLNVSFQKENFTGKIQLKTFLTQEIIDDKLVHIKYISMQKIYILVITLLNKRYSNYNM